MATATVTKGHTFASGDTVTATKLNDLGTPSVAISAIVNADIDAAAAIAGSKLANASITATQLASDAVTTAKIADASSTTTGVTNSKLRHSAALSVVGRTANTDGAPADIAAASDNQVLRRSGTSIGFGTVATDGIADRAITPAKMSGAQTIEQKTASYTLVLDDRGKVIEMNSSSNLTVTIPTNASVAFPTGSTVAITRRGTGEVTVSPDSGVTLRSADSKARLHRQYSAAAVIKIGTNEWLLVGALKT